MASPLDSCVRKLNRAKEHRDSLNSYIAETFAVEANLPRLGTKFEPDSGEWIAFINYMPELGDFIARCSTLLGDAVHNLMAALDHLAFQLALLNSGGALKKPNRVYFPITDTADGFRLKAKDNLGEVAPAHVAIMELCQAYHAVRSNQSRPLFHPLTLLRDLASTDKHKLLIKLVFPSNVIIGMGMAPDFMPDILQKGKRISFPRTETAELGTVVMRAKGPPGAVESDVQMAGRFVPKVCIPPGVGVVDALDRMGWYATKIFRRFEPFF